MTREERQSEVTRAQEAIEQLVEVHLLQEGDIVALHIPRDWSPSQVGDYHDWLIRYIEQRNIDLQFVMLPEDLKLSVIRKAETTAAR